MVKKALKTILGFACNVYTGIVIAFGVCSSLSCLYDLVDSRLTTDQKDEALSRRLYPTKFVDKYIVVETKDEGEA